MMALGYLLAEKGLTHIEIMSLLYEVDHRIKKFVGREDQLRRLAEIASLALLKGQVKRSTTLYSLLDVKNHEDRLEWLYDGILHTKGLAFLTGPPGVGKTVLVTDIMHKMVTGRPVFNRTAKRKLKVLFLSIEMAIAELQHFVEIQAVTWEDGDFQVINENSMIDFQMDVNLQYIEELLKKLKPDVVMIDSLSEIMEDSEEKTAQSIMNGFRRLKEQYTCAFILVHHNRKANSTNKKPVSLSDLYGSYMLGKLAETVLCLWYEQSKNYFELYSMKGRFNDKSTMILDRDKNLTYTVRDTKDIVIELGNNKGRSSGGNALFDFDV